MAKRAAKPIRMELSSGNVLADLGLPDAAELDTKVRLAVEINRLIKDKRLTQVTAAECLEVSQPKISALKNYKLDGFSVERLMSFLLALGQDVEIRISPRRSTRTPGRILVQAT
ncbi:MAG TPA: helix-turn-helix transcriptional regulator [Steroidobacteraceae bacterium]|jgi:predicted XRE-type DNA-binding protein|nr:helix-turn-helix transcriptional regulator [Steroidobacteraceae bacterium]